MLPPATELERRRAARRAALLCATWVALVGQGTACNAILGLNDVLPQAADGGDDRASSAGNGGETGGSAGGASGLDGAGGAVCERELSRNAFFDLGRTQWTIGASEPAELIFRADATELTTYGITPLSGQWALRLGGIRAEVQYLTHFVEQRVIIPANASELTISGYLQVRTLEDFVEPYDKSGVVLYDDGHPPPGEMAWYRSPPPEPGSTWSNLDAQTATTWTMFRFVVDVRAKAGSPTVFRVFADLDRTTPTYFFFDNITVAVTACGP